ALLANRTGELRDDFEARDELALAPLVECGDGEFRPARECSFDTSAIRNCLSDSTHLVSLPKGHEAAVRDLYAWLGVADEPRLEDIASTVSKLSDQPYSGPVALQIQKIITHLGERIDTDDAPVELNFLQSAKWLPARGRSDRWYTAKELYASYQAYL